jgi:hypothetical protein
VLVTVRPAARHGARAPLVGQLPATGLVVAGDAIPHPAANKESDSTMNSAAEVSEQVERKLRAVHVRSTPALAVQSLCLSPKYSDHLTTELIGMGSGIFSRFPHRSQNASHVRSSMKIHFGILRLTDPPFRQPRR